MKRCHTSFKNCEAGLILQVRLGSEGVRPTSKVVRSQITKDGHQSGQGGQGGICPPCTRATPLTGVWPCWWVGEWRKPCASKPTSQQGSCALLAGGWRRKPCASKSFLHSPPSQQGTESLLAGGFTGARLPPLTHQPTGPHPCQGCCPCARWADTNFPRVSDQPSLHSYLIL